MTRTRKLVRPLTPSGIQRKFIRAFITTYGHGAYLAELRRARLRLTPRRIDLRGTRFAGYRVVLRLADAATVERTQSEAFWSRVTPGDLLDWHDSGIRLADWADLKLREGR